MNRRPSRAARIAIYVGLILVVAVVLYPVMLVCKKAFEPGGSDFATSPSPFPHAVTTDHFRALFGSRGSHGELLFLRHTFNSLVIALATTVVGVMLSCTAAYALSRFRFPGRKAGLTTFLVVQMFPATLLIWAVASGWVPPAYLVWAVVGPILIWLAHADNIDRLLHGTERKFDLGMLLGQRSSQV